MGVEDFHLIKDRMRNEHAEESFPHNPVAGRYVNWRPIMRVGEGRSFDDGVPRENSNASSQCSSMNIRNAQ